MILASRIRIINHVSQFVSSMKRMSLLDNNIKFGSKLMLTTTSSSSSYVDLDLDSNRGIGYLTMKNLPVNSLSLEMSEAIVSAVKEAEDNSTIQSLIVRSASTTVFSAGIDLMELHKPNRDRLIKFWTSFQNVFLTLYGSRLSCIAAIEGHAIAGGCMITLCCDYRIMAKTDLDNKICPTIGLNETKLGIVAPVWLGQQMIDTIGFRNSEKSLQLGLLYTPEDALNINLIDSIVTKDTVQSHADEIAKQYTKIPANARYTSKLLSRKQRIDTMIASRQHDLDTFIATIDNPIAQENLSKYLESIAKKRITK